MSEMQTGRLDCCGPAFLSGGRPATSVTELAPLPVAVSCYGHPVPVTANSHPDTTLGEGGIP